MGFSNVRDALYATVLCNSENNQESLEVDSIESIIIMLISYKLEQTYN